MALAKQLIVDNSVCCGCLSCMTTCSLFHHGSINPDFACIHVELRPFEGTHLITFCHHCEDAPCAAACPSGALQIHESGGWYFINDEECLRCRSCESACPHDAIHYLAGADRVFKCDLCGGHPQCVQSCFTRALWYGIDVEAPQDEDKIASRYFHQESKPTNDRN